MTSAARGGGRRTAPAPYAGGGEKSGKGGQGGRAATPASLVRAFSLPRMGRPRMAVSAAFFCFGTIAGSLVPRMPAFKESLGLSDGQVGLVFLAYAVGAVAGAALARPVMGWGAPRPVAGGTAR